MQQIDYFQVFSSMMLVYSNIFSNFTLDAILAQIQLIVIIKTVYFIVSTFLPIEGLVNSIFGPFTYLHQIFHAHAAKKLNNKYREDNGKPGQHVKMNVSLGDTSIRSKEYTNLSFMMNNTSGLTIRDVMYFANSSTVPAFIMLLAIVSVGPLMQDLVFAVIHLYIVCGITLCLMPSKADSKLITNFIIIRTNISPWYVIYVPVTFLVSAGLYAVPYIYASYYPPYWEIEPLLMGFWGVMSYLFLFSFIVLITEEPALFPEEKILTEEKERELDQFLENEDMTLTPEEQILLNDLDSIL